jgi:hypothetical protein
MENPDAPRVTSGPSTLACLVSPFACARYYAGSAVSSGASSLGETYEGAVRATGEAAAEPLRQVGTISIAVAVALGFLALIVVTLAIWYVVR